MAQETLPALLLSKVGYRVHPAFLHLFSFYVDLSFVASVDPDQQAQMNTDPIGSGTMPLSCRSIFLNWNIRGVFFTYHKFRRKDQQAGKGGGHYIFQGAAQLI